MDGNTSYPRHLSCLVFKEEAEKTKSKCYNKTTLEKKSVFFSLDYCLKVSHLRPACGFKNNPTLSNAVISVSINAQTEMSVKRILVSRKSSMVLDLEEVYKQDNESSAHISCDSHSEIKSLIISLGKLLYIKKGRNCKLYSIAI